MTCFRELWYFRQILCEMFSFSYIGLLFVLQVDELEVFHKKIKEIILTLRNELNSLRVMSNYES